MCLRATRHKHAHKPRSCACAAIAVFTAEVQSARQRALRLFLSSCVPRRYVALERTGIADYRLRMVKYVIVLACGYDIDGSSPYVCVGILLWRASKVSRLGLV